MRARSTAALALLALAVPVTALAADEDPPNDSRDEPGRINRIPATITGTTNDAGTGPADDAICADPGGSVWYRIDPQRTRRVVARLEAAGDLDATLDVYLRSRSRHDLLTCEPTDRRGNAAVAFTLRKGETYLVRVARRRNSVEGDFRLRLDEVRGPRLPGPPLPVDGISGSVDRLQNTAVPWSVSMQPGRRHRISLLHRGGCLQASIYKAGVAPRPGREPLERLSCRGYGVFTPRPEHGNRFSIFVFADQGARGDQRYHLQVGPTGADDTAPGLFMRNYARVDGRLGSTLDTIDLYRFDVTRRSALFLNLRTPRKTAALDLVLYNEFGNVVRCDCDGRGDAQLRKGLRPGRYFAAARARGGARAPYTLLRASRTITTTRVRVNGAGSAQVAPGQAVRASALMTPAVSGPVTITFEQFDPVEGWQFARTVRGSAAGGVANVSFVPPTPGRWRATATFDGTREIAPSEAGHFAPIVVGGALRE
jgi:hypothetical protein